MRGKLYETEEYTISPRVECRWYVDTVGEYPDEEGAVYVTIHIDGTELECVVRFSDFGISGEKTEEAVEQFCADLDAVKAAARATLKGKAG